ncbi:DUF2786 domain-containing protein [Hoyosella rhizosphaerae]|uniref:DUF2786 domain-containing protein n=1 Tax=Hoyosella rhizosphaerae TaxID=1755582 RepID=A0A916UD03_9ACTN|nr:DUF2786 domain-containing protein [Hoyosella rhizosphaerae]MBN4925742.1 DUF2786 domain-containing protein [Hoyosella rhizosphaerae]GGC68309.1 hypothetical protein GCM10011410_21300 [Hoyosella rhizosphaerae]
MGKTTEKSGNDTRGRTSRLRFPSWGSWGSQGWGSQPNTDAAADNQWNWPGRVIRPGTDIHTLIMEMILDGAHASIGPKRERTTAQTIADRLATIDAGREPWIATRVASDMLLTAMNSLYEHGWQPLDTIHVVKRAHANAVTDLAIVTVLHHAAMHDAENRAPLSWVEQLHNIAEIKPDLATATRAAATHNPANKPFLLALDKPAPLQTDWKAVLALLGQWHDLPVWPKICPTPSQWPEKRTDAAPRTQSSAPVDARVLNRVRGLLAKAEATTFTNEAEAFTAKAQELMTRYAIDAALLNSGNAFADVHSARIHIDSPYSKAKVHLLHEISLANRVRVVWDADYAIATAVGTPVELRQVEMLYTSTLVQATHAMTAVGEINDDPTTRTASFRRAFLFAYAVRVGQRLQEVGEHTTAREAQRNRRDGKKLLPILAAQNEAVNAAFERLFPQTEKQTAAPMDARGWIAGKVAADQAVLSPVGAGIEAR